MATRIGGRLHGARRILVWLALTAAWAGGTLLLVRHADHPRRARAPESALFGTGAPRTARTGTGGAPGFGATADEPATAPPEIVRGLPEARRVAAAFASAYATWRHDETPEAAAARLARYATPELAARLRAPASGATAARRTLTQQGELATAVAEAVQTQELSAEGVTLLVLVRQELHRGGAVETRRPSYAIRLTPTAPTGAHWRVRDFTP